MRRVRRTEVSLSFYKCLVLATLLIPLPHLRAGPVYFSTPGTVARTPIKLEMSSSPNALIRFTTDGSEPIAQSTLYKEPLTISKTTVLRAAAFDGTSPDASSTRTFVFPEQVIYQVGAGFPKNWGS